MVLSQFPDYFYSQLGVMLLFDMYSKKQKNQIESEDISKTVNTVLQQTYKQMKIGV